MVGNSPWMTSYGWELAKDDKLWMTSYGWEHAKDDKLWLGTRKG